MKHQFISAAFATALIAMGANASAAESYADKAASKSEFESHVEKAGERAREAREAKSAAEGERTRSEAGVSREGRFGVGERTSIGVSSSEGGATVNGRIELEKKK